MVDSVLVPCLEAVHPVTVVDARLRKILLEVLDCHVEVLLCRTVLSKLLQTLCSKTAMLLGRLRVRVEVDLSDESLHW